MLGLLGAKMYFEEIRYLRGIHDTLADVQIYEIHEASNIYSNVTSVFLVVPTNVRHVCLLYTDF